MHRISTRNLYKIFIVIALLYAIVYGHVVYYKYIWTPLEVSKMVPVDEDVEQGSQVTFDYLYCKNTNIKSTVDILLISSNGYIYKYPSSTGQGERGCFETLFGITVPDDIPPGEYIMQFTVAYHPIFGPPVITELKTDTFNVIR